VTFTDGQTDGANLTLIAYLAQAVTVNVSDGSINSESGNGLSLTVNPADIDNYSISAISSPQYTEISFSVTIQARDIYNMK
jgi:hypothetical protein